MFEGTLFSVWTFVAYIGPFVDQISLVQIFNYVKFFRQTKVTQLSPSIVDITILEEFPGYVRVRV